jgi:NAD(P)-dependent dehydrogenase (short-subunit alcohol dehydrogenase family)
MTRRFFDGSDSGKRLSTIPVGRAGDWKDLAGAAVYLTSPASAYVTGAVLPVSGGLGVIDSQGASLPSG